jgi:hypothetical protein
VPWISAHAFSMAPHPLCHGKREQWHSQLFLWTPSKCAFCITSGHPVSAGMYLPLTAVLGGSLFVRPEGYQEAARDVVRLSPHIAELQEQVRGR